MALDSSFPSAGSLVFIYGNDLIQLTLSLIHRLIVEDLLLKSIRYLTSLTLDHFTINTKQA